MALVKLRLGQLVETSEGRQGVVRYIGPIHIAKGEWCGLELADDAGKNDGSVRDQVYFVCEPNHGIFVKKEAVVRVLEESEVPSKINQAPTAMAPTTTTAARTRPSIDMSSGKRHSVVGSRSSTASPVKFPVRTARASISSSTASTPRTATPTNTTRISQVGARPRLSAAGATSTMGPPARKSMAVSTTRPALKPSNSSSSAPAPVRTASPSASRRTSSRPDMDRAPAESTNAPLQEEVETDEEQSEEASDQDEQIAEDPSPRPRGVTTRDTSSRSSLRPASRDEPTTHTNGKVVARQVSTPRPEATHTESGVVLQREIDSLKVKLRAMETKRKEDRDKIKQIDTQQSRIDQLETIIRTMEAKLKQSNEEKRAAQARYEEAQSKPVAEPEMSSQFESELELATLDKEMAEERAELLQLELDELKEKHAELSDEVAILREQNKELTSSMSAEERAGAGWLHLERERDRLKEALLALRDQKISVETELKEEITHLEKEFAEAEETAGKYIEAAEALQKLEDINAELKEELEAIDNQDDMVSSMVEERDRHLQVIERLRVQNSELEELAQTNADLETLYLDNERGLQSRVDEQEAYLNEREREKIEQDRIIEDLELTLNKFRDVVQGLRAEIDEARRSREISEVQALEMKAKSETTMDLNMRLQSSAIKSQAKLIDTELVRTQAVSARKHVEILSAFLTDTLDDEHNPIQAYLVFGQLRSKAKLARGVLFDRLRDRGYSTTNEEILRAYEIVQFMSWIQCSADRFERFICTCSSAEFLTFSNAMSDIDPVLRAVDDWLGALRSDELSHDGPEHMQRMQGILLDLEEKLIPVSTESRANNVCSHADMIESYSDVASSMLGWITSYVQSRLGEPDDEDDDSVEFDRKISQLGTKSRTVRFQTSKISIELAKMRSRHRCVAEGVFAIFAAAERDAADVCAKIRRAIRAVLSQLDENDSELPSYNQLLQTTVGADQVGNISALLDQIQFDLGELHSQVELLSTRVVDAAWTVEFEVKDAPWLVRSRELKSRRSNMSQMQDDLIRAQRLNVEHVSRFAEQEKSFEELTIRVELAERRAKDTRAKDQSDQAFRDEISSLTTAKNDLEKRLTELRVGFDNLEIIAKRDQHDLEALRAASSISARDAAKASLDGSLDPVLAKRLTVHIRILEAEILLLNSTIRQLREENYLLCVPVSEVAFQVAQEAWLDADMLTARERMIRSRHKTAKAQLAAENNDVFRDLIGLASDLQPVRLSRKQEAPRRDEGQQTAMWPGHVRVRETTRYKVARQREELEQWHSWRTEVGKKMDLGNRGRARLPAIDFGRSKAVSGVGVPVLRLDDYAHSKVGVVSSEVTIVNS